MMAAVSVTCSGCSYDYWRFIKNFHGENESFIEYRQTHGVLPIFVNCHDCDKECRYRKEKHLFVLCVVNGKKSGENSVCLREHFLVKCICWRGQEILCVIY